MSYFLLCFPTIKVCSCALSCRTLCDPMDCSLPGSSVHGILQVSTLEQGCHCLLQGIFLTQGLKLHLLYVLHWQVDSLPLNHLGSPTIKGYYLHNKAIKKALKLSSLETSILSICSYCCCLVY